MKIGLTYNLREEYLLQGYSAEKLVEMDSPETIEALETTLLELGHSVERIGSLPSLMTLLLQSKKWDLVFNIAEGMQGFSREGQVPALLDAFGIAYTFSDTLTHIVSLHKGFTKNILQANKIRTADFTLISNIDQIKNQRFKYPLFLKPVAEGTGKGINNNSIVYNKKELMRQVKMLLAEFNQPVMVEKYLSGREYTVGVLGTGDRAEVLGVLEIIIKDNSPDKFYSLLNKEECETYVDYLLRTDEMNEIKDLALRAYKALECRDAARIDIKLDEKDKPYVLEINTLSGLHPTHSDLPMLCNQLGIPYRDLIKRIVESAEIRCQVPGVSNK